MQMEICHKHFYIYFIYSSVCKTILALTCISTEYTTFFYNVIIFKQRKTTRFSGIYKQRKQRGFVRTMVFFNTSFFGNVLNLFLGLDRLEPRFRIKCFL
jgi:hypothetical protein